MWIFVPESLKNNTLYRRQRNQIASKIESLEKKESIYPFFERAGSFYKTNIGNYRLLAKVDYFNGIEVVILQALVNHGKKYNRITHGEEEIKAPYSFSELEEDWNNRIESNHHKVYLEDKSIYSWIQPINNFFVHENEILFMETTDWVQFTKTLLKTETIMNFHSKYLEIEEDAKKGFKELFSSDLFIKSNSINEGIIYSIFSLEERKIAVLIFDGFLNYEEREVRLEKSKNKLTKIGIELNRNPSPLDVLSIHAKRSYPGFVIFDFANWRKIQDDDSANLALSCEEIKVLNDITSGENLPAFINGRAGCGKTTTLLYAFANFIYFRKINKEELPGEIVYVTCSQTLINSARIILREICNSFHGMLNDEVYTKNNIENIINKNMFTFQDLLFEIISKKENSFEKDKYVNFYRYKKMYENFKVRGITPELSWHIIRAYLKGFRYRESTSKEDSFTINDYAEIPTKEKNVSEEDFGIVYNQVWSSYKEKCRQEKLWDDQDLANAALECITSDNENFAVIFCDESQDLTRIELQILLKLSIYEKYNLKDIGYIKRLPFLFAGDPYQTLNPTGFRWENLKEAFYKEILCQLNSRSNINVKLETLNLKINYRSTRPITKFGNTVQLIRKFLFKFNEPEPQKSWTELRAKNPMKFIISSEETTKEICRFLEDTVIIIPVSRSEIPEFIEEDKKKNGIFKFLADGETRRNIFSPFEAKGLEFNKVILYKFGESFEENLMEVIKKSRKEDFFEQTNLKQEYFFNNLYVGASRAKEELIFMETLQGEELFWNPFFSEIPVLLESLKKKKVEWKEETLENINLLENPEELSIGPDQIEDNAKRLKEKGIQDSDPDILLKAAAYFEKIGQTEDMKYCRAIANRINFNFLSAGEDFQFLNLFDDALECFWKGFLWEKFLLLFSHLKMEKDYRYYISSFFNNPDSDYFERFISYLEKNNKKISNDTQTEKAIKTYSTLLLSKTNKKEISNVRAKVLIKYLIKISESTDYLKDNELAELWYAVGEYREAVVYWEKSNASINTFSYLFSKSETTPFPYSIEWISKIESHNPEKCDSLILEKMSNREKDFPNIIDKVGNFLLNTYERKQMFKEAYEIVIHPKFINIDKALIFLSLNDEQETNLQLKKKYLTLLNYFINLKIDTKVEKGKEVFFESARKILSKIRKMNLLFGMELDLLEAEILKKIVRNRYILIETEKKEQFWKTLSDKFILNEKLAAYLISPKEIGAASEYLGFWNECFSFYERKLKEKEDNTYYSNRIIEVTKILLKDKVKQIYETLLKTDERIIQINKENKFLQGVVESIIKEKINENTLNEKYVLPRSSFRKTNFDIYYLEYFLIRIEKKLGQLFIYDLKTQKRLEINYLRKGKLIETTFNLFPQNKKILTGEFINDVLMISTTSDSIDIELRQRG